MINEEKVYKIIQDENLDIQPVGNPDGDNPFWIVSGWNDLEKLVQKFNEFPEVRKYGDVRETSDGECLGLMKDKDGYELKSPFHKPDGVYDIDDILGDYSWGFSDEYTSCSECGNVIRTSPDSYSWKADFWINNGEILCGKCVRDSHVPEYVEYLVNNPERANVILTDTILENIEFQKCKCASEICDFEASFSHFDDPSEIMKKALEKNPELEYIFDITNVGQFGLNYTVWKRENKK